MFSRGYELKSEELLCYKLAEQLRAYCGTEDNLTDCYRLLKDLQYLIRLKKDEYPHLTLSIDFLLHRIETELDCVEFKITHPDLRKRLPVPLKWTGPLVALTGLMYGILPFIDHGKARKKDVAECLEFIFRIKLGNFSRTLVDINLCSEPAKHIEEIKKNLEKVLEEMNR